MTLKSKYSAAGAAKQVVGSAYRAARASERSGGTDDPTNYMAAHGLRLLELGYSPIPIAPYSKKPSRYIGSGQWIDFVGWNRYAERPPTPEEIEEWSGWPSCGVGIIAAGLSQLDIDVRDAALVEEIVEALRREGVAMPDCYRVGMPPKRLYVRQASRPHGKLVIRNSATGNLVEVLGSGQQVVVFNLHPDTRAPYDWLNGSILDTPRADLPSSGGADLAKIAVIAGRLLHKGELLTGGGVAAVDEVITSALSGVINNSKGNVDALEVRETLAAYGVNCESSGLNVGAPSGEAERTKKKAEALAKFGPNTEARIRSVMAFLTDANAANRIPGWDTYKLHVGYGLLDACRDLGPKGVEVAWELFSGFAAANPAKHNPAQTKKDFLSFFTSPVREVNEGSLFGVAMKLGWSDDGKLSANPPPDKLIASEKPSVLPAERLSRRLRGLMGSYIWRAIKVALNRRELLRLQQEAAEGVSEEQIVERCEILRRSMSGDIDEALLREEAKAELGREAATRAKARFMRMNGKRCLEPVRRLVRGSAGGGKSTVAAELIARHWDVLMGMNVQYAVMSHAEAEKIEAELRAAFAVVNASRVEQGLPAFTPHLQVIYGRTNERTGLCDPSRRDLVRKAEGKISSVFSSFCKGKTMAGDDVYCPAFDTCLYNAQFAYQGPGVRIVVHSSLFVDRPSALPLPEPDILFIDERFKSAALERVAVRIGAATGAYGDGAAVGDFDVQAYFFKEGTAYDPEALAVSVKLGALIRGRPDGPLALDVVREIGHADLVYLRSSANLAARSYDESNFFSPAWSQARIERMVEGIEANKARIMERVFNRMLDDLRNLPDKETSNSLWIKDGELVLVNAQRIRVPKSASLVYLDADGRHETAQRLLGEDLKTVKLTAERSVTVVQCYSDAGTKSYLKRRVGDLKKGRERYAGMGDDDLVAASFYAALRHRVEADVAEGKRVLVVSAKSVRDVMIEFGGEAAASPMANDADFNPRVSVPWFGARLSYHPVFIGSNDFRDFDVAHLVGREQPPVMEIEMSVGGLYWDDPTLKLTGKLERRWRRVWLESGVEVYAEVDVHEDPRVQAELESIREDALKQALDRLRLLFDNPERNFPPVVYIHTNIPLPGLAVTRLVPREEMRAGGDKWGRALDANGGLVILDGGWLARHSGWGVVERQARRNLDALKTPGAMPSDAVCLTLSLKDGDGAGADLPVMVSMRVMIETPEDIPALAEDALSLDGRRAAHVDWRSPLAAEDVTVTLDGVEVTPADVCGGGSVGAAGVVAGEGALAAAAPFLASGGRDLVALGGGGIVTEMISACCLTDLRLPGAATVAAAALGLEREAVEKAIRRAKKKAPEQLAALADLVGRPTHQITVRGGHKLAARMSIAMQSKLADAGLTVPPA